MTTTTTTTMMTMTMTTMMTTMMMGLLLAGCVAAAPGNATSCEAMAERLNKRFLVGSNRFDAGGSTGAEARDKLREWMQSNGLLVQMCRPRGYPEVYGPCTDEFEGMDHIAASWIGLTDGAKEMVENDLFETFPNFPDMIGLVFDTSYPKSETLCVSPSDSASVGRFHDADGNPGCGPMKPRIDVGQSNTLDLLEAHLEDKRNGVRNATRELQVSQWVKRYNLGYGNETKGVKGFDDVKWWTHQGTGENVSCDDLYAPPFQLTNWTAITPKNATSLDACSTFGPSDVWTTAIIGSWSTLSGAGSWNPAEEAFLEVLGHPLCVDRSNSCVENANCYPQAGPIEWAAPCTFGPESFMNAMDIQLEMNKRPYPHEKGPAAFQWNELSVPLEANGPGGVEALFTYGNGYIKAVEKLVEKEKPEDQAMLRDIPANQTDYIAYAAKELAENYYGGVPIVYLNPTKENALEGKIFGCSPDI